MACFTWNSFLIWPLHEDLRHVWMNVVDLERYTHRESGFKQSLGSDCSLRFNWHLSEHQNAQMKSRRESLKKLWFSQFKMFLFNVACALTVVIFLSFSLLPLLHAQSRTYSFVIGWKHKERSAREHVSQTSCHPNDDKLAASPLASQSSPDLAFMRAQFLKMEIDGSQVELKVAELIVARSQCSVAAMQTYELLSQRIAFIWV